MAVYVCVFVAFQRSRVEMFFYSRVWCGSGMLKGSLRLTAGLMVGPLSFDALRGDRS
jgi:hypothetical protein